MPLLPCRFQPSYFPPSLPFLTKVIYIMSKTGPSVKGPFWTVIINNRSLVIGCNAAYDQRSKKTPYCKPKSASVLVASAKNNACPYFATPNSAIRF